MDFARKQMESMGWKPGKGLGREEDGIVKPIAPGVQTDTRGLGFTVKDALQLDNQWWTQAYNAASKGLKPEYKITSVGVIVKPKNEDQDETSNATTETSSATAYNGHFVSETVLKEVSVPKIKKEKKKKKMKEKYSKKSMDLNEIFSKNKELVTCHKAARLGIKMNGKIQRIQEQEMEFLRKNNSNLPSSSST